MRCLALAQAWQERGGRATFLSHCDSDLLPRRIVSEGFDFIPLERTHPAPCDIEQTVTILAHLESQNAGPKPWLALDGYHFDTQYQYRIKEEGYKLLWIDDYGHADYFYADIILNQNISAVGHRYMNREAYTRVLLGSPYVLLRREFLLWREPEQIIPSSFASRILVTMGGSDPCNTTLKILRALREVTVHNLEVAVIVGPANPHRHQVEDEIGRAPFTGHCFPSVENMPEKMAWADIAVSAGGSTCWELAFMGLPNIIIISSDNQKPIAEGLDAAGAAINLGWHHQVVPQQIAGAVQDVLSQDHRRKEMRAVGRKLVDGRGLTRLLSVCGELA
jgi:UDP-2,4-diacetamido-2,4,6-trideoxy-beta-L-altropyranose hydrolase